MAWTLPLLACATVPMRTPDEGGPRWSELTTPHFLVTTDLSSDAAGAVAAELEATLADVKGAGAEVPLPNVRTHAIVLAEPELSALAPDDPDGFAHREGVSIAVVLPDGPERLRRNPVLLRVLALQAAALANAPKLKPAVDERAARAAAAVTGPAPALAPDARPLTGAEVHLLRAELTRWSPSELPKEDRRARMAADLRECLRADPLNPEALKLLGALVGWDAVRPMAPDLVVRRSDDWRTWYFAALAIDVKRPDAEAQVEAALERAHELAPDEPDVLNELAWTWATHGRAQDALPLATRALERVPWSAPVLDTDATAVLELGQCPEALAAEGRAIDAELALGASAEVAGYRRHLFEMQSRCPAAH